jgi:hypothetical protein
MVEMRQTEETRKGGYKGNMRQRREAKMKECGTATLAGEAVAVTDRTGPHSRLTDGAEVVILTRRLPSIPQKHFSLFLSPVLSSVTG